MGCKLAEVMDAVEEIVPGEFAEEWDNCGMQLGDPDWQVEKVWVALDPIPEVIAAACQADVDLVITHHPLIFKPLSIIDVSRPEGFIIQQALDHQVAIYAAHTNLDRVQDGVNDVLASKIGLGDTRALSIEGGVRKARFWKDRIFGTTNIPGLVGQQFKADTGDRTCQSSRGSGYTG